ncbi:MAG: hypothetical protein AB7O37_11975 [Vicinamibacteria bacterium]
MNGDELLIANGVRSAIILALAGLFVRRRAALCWSFVAYLMAILVCNSLISFWPDRFFLLWFYILKESLYDLLKLAIAAELAFRTFKAFPGARARARLLLAPLVAALVGVLLLKALQSDPGVTVLRHHPLGQTATIWLFAAMSLLAVWFHVPVHPFHRALLMGFTSYLIVFVSLLNVLRTQGWDLMRQTVSGWDTRAYLALVLFFAWSAWRRYDRVAVPASAPVPLPEAARP